jgi:hypothetical protein
MKVAFSFVSAGDTESDYGMECELDVLPNPGDYISVRKPGERASCDFIVKRAFWSFHKNDKQEQAEPVDVLIVCEYVISPFSTESHKKCSGSGAQEMDMTGIA